MKDFCIETYKRAIEEVLFTIKMNLPHITVNEIIGGLEYALKMLNEKEPEDARYIRKKQSIKTKQSKGNKICGSS